MNVLVSRSDQRGQALVDMLNQQNIFAIHQPLFAIESGQDLPKLPSCFSRLNNGDYVFAVSKHAIDFAVETLKHTGFGWRLDLNYFAVGQQSANYFSTQIEQTVRYPVRSENSEGLLQLLEMHTLLGKNLLILRAESGRNFLIEQAISRGATVSVLECYRKVLLNEDLGHKIGLLKRVGVDTVVVTSGQILMTLFQQTLAEDHHWLRRCRLFVVGQRTACLAYKLGWKPSQVVISHKADNATLLAILLQHREN